MLEPKKTIHMSDQLQEVFPYDKRREALEALPKHSYSGMAALTLAFSLKY